MKTKITVPQSGLSILPVQQVDEEVMSSRPRFASRNTYLHHEVQKKSDERIHVLFMTSYPPRECGIATYSQDLVKALDHKFRNSIAVNICALESEESGFAYPEEVEYVLNTTLAEDYQRLASQINLNSNISIVLIQHEFGFFKAREDAFMKFLIDVKKPIVIVFHTVLPHPDLLLKSRVKRIASLCKSVIVMTHNSANILAINYDIPQRKISVIAHGTHLVHHINEKILKQKYELANRKVLTTFGLLSSGKSIETTLEALPAILKQCGEVIFLIIGKTHPEVFKAEGEKYRNKLEQIVVSLGLEEHVRFINRYLDLPELLEYLQLTDIYLFTTNDPNQAVSGTFSYAMSCACPIISTSIPHAREVLQKIPGLIFDFQDSEKLAENVIRLMNNDPLRRNVVDNILQYVVSTAWENSALAHTLLFREIMGKNSAIHYDMPEINLNHIHKITSNTGIIQFSKINQPDINSGYTLDDNARALIAMGMHYELTADEHCIPEIIKYLNFVKFCQQPNGDFLNYVDKNLAFTDQNKNVNLDDSNGRAVWALGYILSLHEILPENIIAEADIIFNDAMRKIEKINSTRAMAFVIKGIYYAQNRVANLRHIPLMITFANRMVQMYKHEADEKWEWYEGYLTYANSILPEAMLYAWKLTDNFVYKEIAIESFEFLLTHIFNDNGIEVISNRNWLLKGAQQGQFGEQPIDVAYTILALNAFYEALNEKRYLNLRKTAFNWFLGNNRLHQIIYNPCTGGCYDGLEEKHVNLNQGAESTVSYLMARLIMEKNQD